MIYFTFKLDVEWGGGMSPFMKVDKGFMIFQYLSCFCLAAIDSNILSLDPVFAVSMFMSLSASSMLSIISDCFLETDSSSPNLSSVNISSGRSFSSPASTNRIIIIFLMKSSWRRTVSIQNLNEWNLLVQSSVTEKLYLTLNTQGLEILFFNKKIIKRRIKHKEYFAPPSPSSSFHISPLK